MLQQINVSLCLFTIQKETNKERKKYINITSRKLFK